MLPLPHADVIYKKLPEGGILFHCTDEVYFGLNPAGARVWELLPDAESVDALGAALAAEHPGVDPGTVRADVAELLEALAAHGLMRAPAAPAGAA
jgi:hypothetical protein